MQTFCLLLLAANNGPGLLLNLARDVLYGALDLIFIHNYFSQNKFKNDCFCDPIMGSLGNDMKLSIIHLCAGEHTHIDSDQWPLNSTLCASAQTVDLD